MSALRSAPALIRCYSPNLTLQGRYVWNRTTLENNGVGGFNLLSSRATRSENTTQGIQLTETQVIGARLINESRFQYRRTRSEQSGDSTRRHRIRAGLLHQWRSAVFRQLCPRQQL